ncbi:MAG TPA: DUF5606 domain-containing protein [Chitinophagaceae bacterium]|jgi:hypothetical protein|nr:DUF5606 domain-containing protein [Chitinophagaceae bacterium]
MEYSKIIAVTGLPGLFELISSKSDGAIIRSLEDKTTRFASSRIHNFSHLESIEIYTKRENVNLVDIFHAMDKTGGKLPDSKNNDAVKQYFETVYPDLDFERVYNSDLKKMVKWFDVLKKNNIEIKLSEPPAEPDEVQEAPQEPATEEKPKKTAKKAAAKIVDDAETAAEEPKKKKTTTRTKKEETGEEKTAKPAKKKKS